MEQVRNRRQIIDRRAVGTRIASLAEKQEADLRNAVFAELREAMEEGRAAIEQRFVNGEAGDQSARAMAFLVDQIIRLLYDHALNDVFHAANPTDGEQMSVVAVGGYGRGQMAPQSDVDLLFLLPYKQTAWSESMIEYMLYMLWDLKLKVGHSTRTIDDCIRLSKQDTTIRTALLEARFIFGDQNLFLELQRRFRKDVVQGSGTEYVELKLAERDERHQRFGDSRYVNEPNLKEGKGGMRDLHTLTWIAKYVYKVADVGDLVERGIMTAAEYRRFVKAERFLWSVRFHLHLLTNRPEERLTFDVQTELATRLGYTDRAGAQAIERFMKHYYLVARDIGDLTRVICSSIEAENQKKPLFRLPRFGLRTKQIDGFVAEGSWLNVEDEEMFAEDPVAMLRIFQVAQANDLDIHPDAHRLLRRHHKKINRAVRNDPVANRCFLDIMTSRKDPETHLRRMSEAGILGQFITDFGRVVAQTQHDMYHHYTVDEHTLRAVGLVWKIEQGGLAEEHPLSHEIVHQVLSREVLYMAVFLHDIAKGRGGDHSVLGEKVALKLCKRLGFSAGETEMVAWLVRAHLLMSATAFKRDLSDAKTIQDFVALVQSPERLRLLLILTVADIRAVGPGVWNGWKGQLLRDLYYRAEEALSGDMRARGPKQRVAAAKEALAEVLNTWSAEDLEAHTERFYDGYWLGIDTDTQAWHAGVMRKADQNQEQLAIATRSDQFKAMTEILVYAADHPGLFSRIAGAMAVARVNIVDARISTTHDGMAVDTFIVQDMDENALSDPQRLDKLREAVARTLAGEVRPRGVIAERKPGYAERTRVFKVEPVVLIDNNISNTWTVIEVNGRDRPGFIHDVAWALFNLSLNVGRARIATYGERAVDVFYVRDMFGLKIDDPNRHERIRQRLIEAIQQTTAAPAAATPAKSAAAKPAATKQTPKAQKATKR
ncbi:MULTISPECIES: [protein-PII] uridylyltransferase [unclassified Minwuia]|uniref:[protein-PII] uridylyltransferase n=1 Tax=unclassified Minwuia TaxID=2618799 RepID=UPI0024798EE3|nr:MULTISPECIES: [protein-PII] uridylyltransferase [unclassified Minwuia]